MKTAKSSGYDKISVKLLQAAGGAIVVPLTYIFNQSLKTRIFHDDWKNEPAFIVGVIMNTSC
jgi:hypothetical protein